MTELTTSFKKIRENNDILETDRSFLSKQLVESKRQNKLLKLAIGRL